MVTHIISCDFDLSDGAADSSMEDPLNLSSQTPEQMLDFYERTLAIHAKAKTLPTQDSLLLKTERGVPGGICKLYRENAISKVRIVKNGRLRCGAAGHEWDDMHCIIASLVALTQPHRSSPRSSPPAAPLGYLPWTQVQARPLLRRR